MTVKIKSPLPAVNTLEHNRPDVYICILKDTQLNCDQAQAVEKNSKSPEIDVGKNSFYTGGLFSISVMSRGMLAVKLSISNNEYDG